MMTGTCSSVTKAVDTISVILHRTERRYFKISITITQKEGRF